MKEFQNRLQLTSEQRKEVQRYLNSMTILSEEVILKLVRKIKQLEQRIDENKYNR